MSDTTFTKGQSVKFKIIDREYTGVVVDPAPVSGRIQVKDSMGTIRRPFVTQTQAA